MGPCGESVTIWAEGHTMHHHLEIVQAEEYLAGLSVPEFNCPIHASRKETPAIGGEGHAENRILVTAERTDDVAGLGIPELNGIVRARRSQRAAVRAEGQSKKLAVVSAERQGAGSRILVKVTGIPDPYRAVRAGGGQALPVRTEQDTPDQVQVAAQAEDFLTRGRVPQPHD